MNVILKELLIAETATGKGWLSDEDLANFITKEYDVEGPAVVLYVKMNYSELVDDQETLTKIFLEDNVDGYTVKAMLAEFDDAYFGTFESVEDFAEELFQEMAPDTYKQVIKSGLGGSIDWLKYWQSTLQFDYYFSGNYYFRNL
jgi:hypothetical protein